MNPIETQTQNKNKTQTKQSQTQKKNKKQTQTKHTHAVTDFDQKINGFQIIPKDKSKRIWRLHATDEQSKKQWIECITMYIGRSPTKFPSTTTT